MPDLGVIVVRCTVLMLYVLAARREEGQRVEVVMSRLVAAGDETTVIEELRSEVNDGVV